MNAALAMSSFEHPYAHGRQYFESIVSLLDSRKGSAVDLSELDGGFRVLRLYCVFALCAQANTLTNTGTSMKPANTSANVKPTMLAALFRQPPKRLSRPIVNI
jgi:hypothetical protein